MRFINGFFGYLWRLSRGGALGSDVGARWGSGQAALYTFLWLLFLVVAIVLVIMGFDLETVDRWLDARSGVFELIGDVLFRVFFGFVFVMCGMSIWALIDEMRSPQEDPADGQRHIVRRSFGILAAIAIGWFAWIGLTGSY